MKSMKIYELQHYEYVQNTDRSLEKKRKYVHSIFKMYDTIYILQYVPQTMKNGKRSPCVTDNQ